MRIVNEFIGEEFIGNDNEFKDEMIQFFTDFRGLQVEEFFSIDFNNNLVPGHQKRMVFMNKMNTLFKEAMDD